MFQIPQADRLKALPPYLFKELDRMRDEVRSRGVDIIDLGVGDPDQPTPDHVIDRLCESARDAANHQYPSYSGMNDFREAVADFYQRRHKVDLDPGREVVTLIGSKEGIAHIPLAFINPGDVALVPEPAYPVYHIGNMFAGGRTQFMPLLEENGFLPDLKAVDPDVARQAKLMYINYPNNPTGATAPPQFYEEVVKFALTHEIAVVSDAAYSELTFDGYEQVSILEVPGGRDVAVEFHSLSKTYNMTGWRIAWAAGREDLVEGLGRIKSNIDSGAFQAVQWAGVEALSGDQRPVEAMRRLYAKRRDVLVEGLKKAGLDAVAPKATFFVWVKTPAGYGSADFAAKMLSEAGVVATPGAGFGPSGEGYVRFALTKDEDRLEEAARRIKDLQL